MQLIKDIFLYANASKDEYDRITPDILRMNRLMLCIFSGIASIFITGMTMLSFFVQSTSQNRFVYLGGTMLSIFLFCLSMFYSKNHSWIVIPLVYLAFSIFLIYGIFIGTITNPTQQTVTFMVMLIFLPFLFVDRPIRIIITLYIYVTIFIVLCFKRKTGAVFSIDVMDALIYGTLGAASGTIINMVKVKSYVLERKLNYASQYDTLTGMNNRNSFEWILQSYPKKCKRNLFCVYIDVNGLHELNNTKGHAAGDKMLQFVANNVKKAFGNENTYRIGGDEFVAFSIDSSETEIEVRIEQLIDAVEAEGYRIAFGHYSQQKADINMDVLIREAETLMYKNKTKFYSEAENDRRRRRN